MREQHRWWTRQDMTSPARIAAAARERDLYVDQFTGVVDGVELPTVLCRVGGQLWLVHPQVDLAPGWVAGQARHSPGTDGILDEVDSSCRWLGPADAPAAQIMHDLIVVAAPPTAAGDQ